MSYGAWRVAVIAAIGASSVGCRQLSEFRALEHDLTALESDVRTTFGDASVRLVNGKDLTVALLYVNATRPLPDSLQRDSLATIAARFVRQRYARMAEIENIYIVFSDITQAGNASLRVNYPYVKPARIEP